MTEGRKREWERERERDRLFRVVRKSRCVSGSLDRPRPFPAPSTSPLSLSLSLSLSFPRPTSALFPPPPSLLYSTLLQSRPFPSGLYLVLLVKMGAIPEADPDEPQETKPFKFVTGELSSLVPYPPLWLNGPWGRFNC